MQKKDVTLEYYNENASSFVQGTVAVDFKATQDAFLKALSGKKILDFGCGSGRDTKYFLEAGYDVDAIDGSAELCRKATKFTGIEVRQMLFQELDAMQQYDGIWACASILHLPKEELQSVFDKMEMALRPEGIIYTSFKYGDFEGMRSGRYFIDFTEAAFAELMKSYPKLQIIETWITGDVRAGRGDEQWLNILLRKVDSH